jgi:hypothetical protein
VGLFAAAVWCHRIARKVITDRHNEFNRRLPKRTPAKFSSRAMMDAWRRERLGVFRYGGGSDTVSQPKSATILT